MCSVEFATARIRRTSTLYVVCHFPFKSSYMSTVEYCAVFVVIFGPVELYGCASNS